MGAGDQTAIEQIRRRVTDEIYAEQRRLVDRADAAGISLIAISVPFLLWDFVGHSRLLIWGGLLLAFTLSWKGTTEPDDAGRPFSKAIRGLWIWGSSILWAILPWLQPSAIENNEVAWVLVFVVAYGIAADVVLIPQTGDTALAPLLSGYTTSYIVAFAYAGQWWAAGAAGAFLILLVFGANGWKRLTINLIDKRVESDIRALIDTLTGVGTRAAATLAVIDMVDNGADAIHCAFFDVDDFKQLNDTYGYATGDDALRRIAEHLVDRLPDDWQVARFGGDEFVAVGPGGADLESLAIVSVPLPDHASGVELGLTLSIGSTTLPAATATSHGLFREAGAALRSAKATGKHRIVSMTPRLRASEAERLALGAAVADALESGDIVAHGQAVTDLRTGRPVGVELLARWPQPDGSVVMPLDFVPVIEEQGRGPQLGDLMLGYAVEFLAELRAAGRSDVYATVNISARHLFHGSLAHSVAKVLEGHGVPPHQLILEVTESQHLPQSSIWRTTAEQLRTLGVGLAIDDFGTGYSSMEQLLSLPFTHLKVDRIITQSFDRPGAGDLAAAIAAMAHGGDMVAVAEGIETETERRQMLDAGYLFGQGYLFGRPRPLADLLGVFADPVVDHA